MRQAQITHNHKGIQVTAGSYRFFLDSVEPRAVLRSGANGAGIVISLAPMVNGARAQCAVTRVQVEETSGKIPALVATLAMPGATLDIRCACDEAGVAISCTTRSDSIAGVTLCSISGDFNQLHSFVPDLARIALPENTDIPIQIDSHSRAYSDFFQFDNGNFMMPPYLLAVSGAAGYLGVGLAEIPDRDPPVDCSARAGVLHITARMQRRDDGAMGTPRWWISPATDREDVLSRYRAFLGQPAPATVRDWWKEPIYTTWGDQVYAKHIASGSMASEQGSERFLSSVLVNNALDVLTNRGIEPKTVVLDEGWARECGDWTPADERFEGSLKAFIENLHARGLRVILWFSPFLARESAPLARQFPETLLCDEQGAPVTLQRGGGKYRLWDWSHQKVREAFTRSLATMISAAGLDADGVKIAGARFFPPAGARLNDTSFGEGEKHCKATLAAIYETVKREKPGAAVFLPCLNPLFADVFDIVRLGNISEVNHELYIQRAQTASWLLPTKPTDTDDWASFQKAVGTATLLKTLAGIPNLFSSGWRGDGRFKVQGGRGGNPVAITDRQYAILATAWRMYEHSKDLSRSNLRIDFDRLEFSTPPADGRFMRTYQGAQILAIYRPDTILLCSLQDTKAIIDIPKSFSPASVIREANGERGDVPFTRLLDDKIAFDMQSSAVSPALYFIQEG